MEPLKPGPHVQHILDHQVSDLKEEDLFPALQEVTDYTEHWQAMIPLYGLEKTITVGKQAFQWLYDPNADFESEIELNSMSSYTPIHQWTRAFINDSENPLRASCYGGFEKDFQVRVESIKSDTKELEDLFQISLSDYKKYGVKGQLKIAQHLLTLQPDLKGYLKWSDLHVAIFLEKPQEEIESLITPENINASGEAPRGYTSAFKGYYTPVTIAKSLGREDLVELLIEKGAEPPPGRRVKKLPEKKAANSDNSNKVLLTLILGALVVYSTVKGLQWLFSAPPSARKVS
ncbi:MAG: hypothetical protein H7A41_03395 [Chlamydiales bacterium]|nr:hypothetical protein [Chlamydiales bacterium]